MKESQKERKMKKLDTIKKMLDTMTEEELNKTLTDIINNNDVISFYHCWMQRKRQW